MKGGKREKREKRVGGKIQTEVDNKQQKPFTV